MNRQWGHTCEMVQESLMHHFFNEAEGIFENHYPVKEDENFIYWWHAHGIDAMIDGFLRTKDLKYRMRIEKEYRGVFRCNGSTLIHNWYDDMEWMALALLRLWDITKNDDYKRDVYTLWDDIKTAWNGHMGGGLAWKKDQLDYKNTPANGPAAILAYRLYQRFHQEQDLEWGNKILDWNMENLMDRESGFVYDGMNRLGDGAIDYDWKFTYCQGVIIGALIERYAITKEETSIDAAISTALEAMRVLSDEEGILLYEGEDDCGLFRGIFVRYLCELAKLLPERVEFRQFIRNNGSRLLECGINDDGLIGSDWSKKSQGTIDLAQHLSGIMLLEMAAVLD